MHFIAVARVAICRGCVSLFSCIDTHPKTSLVTPWMRRASSPLPNKIFQCACTTAYRSFSAPKIEAEQRKDCNKHLHFSKSFASFSALLLNHPLFNIFDSVTPPRPTTIRPRVTHHHVTSRMHLSSYPSTLTKGSGRPPCLSLMSAYLRMLSAWARSNQHEDPVCFVLENEDRGC